MSKHLYRTLSDIGGNSTRSVGDAAHEAVADLKEKLIRAEIRATDASVGLKLTADQRARYIEENDELKRTVELNGTRIFALTESRDWYRSHYNQCMARIDAMLRELRD